MKICLDFVWQKLPRQLHHGVVQLGTESVNVEEIFRAQGVDVKWINKPAT